MEEESIADRVGNHLTTLFHIIGMWVRDHYFPKEYRHATWQRLAPFFRLSGRVAQEVDIVRVELHPFNDRQFNRDLAALCAKVDERRPRLPDGRRLVLVMDAMGCPNSDAHNKRVA